jgi:hypothetical protein
MLSSKRVTEADVEATGKRLAEAYEGFKKALASMPSEAVRPVADTVRSHPYASLAAAAGAGFMAYRLLGLLLPREKVIIREAAVEPAAGAMEKRKPSLASRILSELASYAAPYIMDYVKGEVDRVLSHRLEKSGPGGP